MLEGALLTALGESKNERELQPFLKRNLILVRNALNAWAWNFVDIIPEFKLGSELRTDYLILSADSCQWHAILVELKSHRTKLFNAAGIPTRSLGLALRQLDDWERWIARHEAEFRSSLSNRFRRGRVPAQCSRADVHCYAHTEIIDPRTVINFGFKVLMGRRSDLQHEDQERRGSYYDKGREIITYDRLLDMARRQDEASAQRCV